MRKTVAVLVLTLVTMLGIWVPSVSAAYVSNAKVVIIVGAVHGQTDSYRTRGNAAYAEAIKYTPNVTKVYSPNATWSKVKSATKGANIVIYMGHGNGWPSPYTYDPNYTTKDGFGLNATSGAGDNNVKYYGEPYVDDLELAPNAIILLHHLCYASGNSEPGHPEPSTTTAKQRVDNYGAGFLRGRARAVVAEGHAGAAYYLRALFTTSQSILSVWRNAPNYNGNEFSFPGTRSAGYRAYMDPDAKGKGFYRSLVGKQTLTTTEITGVIPDTGVDPGTFVVPGRASVASSGAQLLDTNGDVVSALDPNVRLELVTRPNWTTDDGLGVFEVAGLDQPAIGGFVSGTQLVPRDSAAPIAIAAEDAPGLFSPNDDGTLDTTMLSARYSETVDWTLRIRNSAGSQVASASGTGKEPSVEWKGRLNGSPVPDGTYTYTFEGQDAWLNAPSPVAISGTVKVDTAPPSLSNVPQATDPLPAFSPNGDGVADTFALKGTTSESGKIQVGVRPAGESTLIRNFSAAVSSGSFSIPWDGRDNNGAVVPDGTYDVRLVPVDAAGNTGASATITVRSLALLAGVKSTKTLFYPQDGDALAKSTYLRYKLTRPATVTWTIRNAKGDVVRTLIDAGERAAGSYSFTFNGRRADGTMLPAGKYSSHLSATDGGITVSASAKFEMNAFKLTSSTSTPKRGKSITITAKPAEKLGGSVTMSIFQPGKSAWTVRMTKLSSGSYRATVTLKTGGSAGTLKISVQAKDANGGRNKTYLKLPLS